MIHQDMILKVKNLKKHFPVKSRFFSKEVDYLKAV